MLYHTTRCIVGFGGNENRLIEFGSVGSQDGQTFPLACRLVVTAAAGFKSRNFRVTERQVGWLPRLVVQRQPCHLELRNMDSFCSFTTHLIQTTLWWPLEIKTLTRVKRFQLLFTHIYSRITHTSSAIFTKVSFGVLSYKYHNSWNIYILFDCFSTKKTSYHGTVELLNAARPSAKVVMAQSNRFPGPFYY